MLGPDTPPAIDSTVVIIGHGHDRGDAITVSGYQGILWAFTFGTKRWGTNKISNNTGFTVLRVTFDPPGSGLPEEAQGAVHDSGGGAFHQEPGGLWQLAGIMSAPTGQPVTCPGAYPINCSFYGQFTHIARPNPSMRAWILDRIALPECGDELDDDFDGQEDLNDSGCRTTASLREDPACSDGLDNDSDGYTDHLNDPGCLNHPWGISETNDADSDTVYDPNDNCSMHSNLAQTNADSDGFGNRCDGDFDQSGVVNFADLQYLKSKFYTSDALADLSGDNIVNFIDLGMFKGLFLKPPGPGAQPPPP